MQTYVKRDPRMITLFNKLRERGGKIFLLTNSEYYYTECIMAYLIDKNWKDLFDIIIVSANKPRFFEEGTTLREVDLVTGNLKTSHAVLEKGKVFAGGSISVFDKSTMVPGNQVLYIGDHIFADIMRSKKKLMDGEHY